MRQNRLARQLGVDETVLSKLINGYRIVTPELRERIAVALQCDADWLFEPDPLVKSDSHSERH